MHAAAVGRRARLAGLVWVRLGDLEKVALSGPHRKWTSRHLSGRDRVKGAGA